MGQTLETVSHCWRYSRLLTFQLSAFVLRPPQSCDLIATIYYCRDDGRTAAVLDYFAAMVVPRVRWNFQHLPQSQLCRRAIGRNHAAQNTAADFLLYSDVDYIFGRDALDQAAARLAEANADGPKLCYPRFIEVTRTHELGDTELARAEVPGTYDISIGDYIQRVQPRAIGGNQWVTGDWARKHGYLPNSRRYQRPARHWRKTTEDVTWRRCSGLQSVPLVVPNIYRITHSKRGRDHIGVEL